MCLTSPEKECGFKLPLVIRTRRFLVLSWHLRLRRSDGMISDQLLTRKACLDHALPTKLLRIGLNHG